MTFSDMRSEIYKSKEELRKEINKLQDILSKSDRHIYNELSKINHKLDLILSVLDLDMEKKPTDKNI